ncbi:MAG: hypothetical protein ING19_07385 [Azospirillum sp.]|nr:hypothetical protein [Azospirillum sp.]
MTDVLTQDQYKKQRLFNVLIVAATIVTALYLVNRIYGDVSTDALAEVFGRWIGSAMVVGLVVYPLTRKPPRQIYRGPIWLSAALVALVVGYYDKLSTISAIEDARSGLANVAGPTSLSTELERNSTNPFIAFIAYSRQVNEDALREITDVLGKIAPTELELSVDLEKAPLETVIRLRNASVTAAGNARGGTAVVEFIFVRERNRLQEHLSKATRIDADSRAAIMRGVQRRQADYLDFFKKLLELRAAEYDASTKMFALFVEEHGRITRSREGQWLFRNQALADRFNAILRESQAAERAAADHEKLAEVLDARYAKLFEQFVSPGVR